MAKKRETYTQADWENLGKVLQGLPEKPKAAKPINAQSGAQLIKKQIAAARAKGYTLEELVKLAADNGIVVSQSSLKITSAKRKTAQPQQEKKPD